ncbi:MAG TPA: tyrosine recombinase XerC [Gammaproteobacteria bacterium]|nr:tyrosine recombinase XerC [Gammaproteobacteria bacterium]
MSDALEEPIARFIAHLVQRNLSPHTRSNYARDLGTLRQFCIKQGVGDWAVLDVHRVRAFVTQRHRQGLAPKSLQRLLACIRSFYDYLQEEGLARNNPAEGVRAPKAAKRLPDTLDADQMARLLQIEGGDAETVRDRAVMELLYSSGLRLAELISIRLSDIDLREGLVTVTGKGRKTRIVPVGRQALKALGAWLKVRGQLAKPDDTALFVGVRGGALSPRTVQARLKRWGLSQGVQQGVHPHLFRHSFASHVLESSGDLRAVQELLGHANISTTQIYTHLDFQHLAKTYDAAHPRAKKKKGAG